MSKELIEIKVNDIVYSNWTDASIFKSIEMASGEFIFSSSNINDEVYYFDKGDECVALIDDKPMITGFINVLGGSYDADSHELNISGRDKTQDLIDCSINGVVDFKGGVTLETIIKRILTLNGITDIKIISTEKIKPFSASEIVTADVTETGFSLIEKYCRLRQVLFTTNGDGDIVLTKAGKNKYTTMLKNEFGANDNNILSAKFQDSDQERFNTYLVISQGNLVSGIEDSQLTIKSGKPALDDNIRATRILKINTNASDIKTLTDRAIWESNLRRVRQFQYNCKIRGYYLDAEKTVLIEPNNLITVKDDMFGIDSELLIKSCRYVKSLREGSVTLLELVNKDAYTLQAQIDEVEAKFNKKK